MDIGLAGLVCAIVRQRRVSGALAVSGTGDDVALGTEAPNLH